MYRVKRGGKDWGEPLSGIVSLLKCSDHKYYSIAFVDMNVRITVNISTHGLPFYAH